MPPERKPSGQVIQENEAPTWSDLAEVKAETGDPLKVDYVVGKNPEVRKTETNAVGLDEMF